MVPITTQFQWLQVIDGVIGNIPAEHLTSVYGNGWQAVFPFMEMVMQPYLTACVTASYGLCNCVLRFMEMVGKQFSPFMEMVVQPCLTACATVFYDLCNYVLQLV
jgi:hypothetical protein